MTRQSDFRAAILDAARPAPVALTDGHGRAAGRRFNVYRNNVAVSLTEALETAFPAVAKLVGDQNFRALAREFLRLSPPDSPLMMQYGAAFPAFLEGVEPLAHLGYLPDVARLEQALRQSYHATDAAPLTGDDMAAIAPEDLPDLCLAPLPATCLLQSPWPIHDIWRLTRDPDAPKPRPEPQDILITRINYDPAPHLLPTGAAAFLKALSQGQPLGPAGEQATAHHPNFDLGATLALLLNTQAIAQIQPEETA